MKPVLKQTTARFAAALMLGASIQYAHAKVYSFGDSYSDNGNINIVTSGSQPGPGYWAGRFTNGWTVAERITYRLTCNSPGRSPGLLRIEYPPGTGPCGGVNFAHGGATAITRSALPAHLSVINQTKYFRESWSAKRLSVSSADTGFIWAGTNDYLVYSGSAASSVVGSIVNSMVANVAATGVGNVIVLNLHNLGDLPGWVNGPSRANLNALTASHNAQLATALAAAQPKYRAKLILVDVNRAISLAHQGRAGGFTVTRPGQNGSISGNCVGDGRGMWSCPDTYLYYDYAHFTRSGHEYIASIAHDRFNAVLAQAKLGSLRVNGAATAVAGQSLALGTRFAELQASQPESGKLGVFAFGVGAEPDGSGAAFSQSSDRNFGGGADIRWGEWFAGASAFQRTPGDERDSEAAELTVTQSASGVSAYLGWVAPDEALTVSATHIRGQQETERLTSIKGLPVATGQAGFTASAVDAMASKSYAWGAWSLKGEAALRYDDLRIAGFEETGTLGLSDTVYDANETKGVAGRIGLSVGYRTEDFNVTLGAHALSRLYGDAPIGTALPVAIPGGNNATHFDTGLHAPLDLGARAFAATLSTDWRVDDGARLTVEAAAIATPEGEVAAGVSFGAKFTF